MTIIIILLFVVAAVLAYLGMYKWAMIAAGVAVLLLVFKGVLGGPSFKNGPVGSTNVGGVDVANDTCGCGPGQVVKVAKKNVFNKWNEIGTYPCALALGLVNKNSKKYAMHGCV
jgi:hypothetical protein